MWRIGDRVLALGERTLLMGILNCTPDSFSDGGRHSTVKDAAAHGLSLLEAGADLLDLGAESTRPGATPVSAELEQHRLLPVLQALRRARPEALLSVDTYHAGTAAAAIADGADVINDVSGLLWDQAMVSTLAAARPQPGVVIMHARGSPASWAQLPPLPDGEETALVVAGLAQQLSLATSAGLDAERVVLDPGFGFGKRGGENIALLARLSALLPLGRPLLIGLSRKGFLAEPRPGDQAVATSGDSAKSDPCANSDQRLHATIAANTAAVLAGAHLLRVHDVAAARASISVADRLLRTVAAVDSAPRTP